MEEYRVCKKCLKEKPATVEYFSKKTGCVGGIDWRCRECCNKYAAEYKKRNIERIREWERQSSIKNKDKNKEYKRIYSLENKDLIIANRKIFYKNNKEKLLSHMREYQIGHRAEHNVLNHKYRSRKRELPRTLTVAQWNDIVSYFDYKCVYCGEIKELQQEHLYPMSLGGEYAISNIICACRSCNSSKGATLFAEWYPRQKFYSKGRESKILRYLNYKHDMQQLSFV